MKTLSVKHSVLTIALLGAAAVPLASVAAGTADNTQSNIPSSDKKFMKRLRRAAWRKCSWGSSPPSGRRVLR